MINRLLIEIIVFIGVIIASFLYGMHYENNSWTSKVAKQSVQVAQAQQKQADITAQVVTKYVDRVKVIHDQGAVITKEVKVYVPQSVDCTVPIGFVRMLNSAASDELPNSSQGANADSSSFTDDKNSEPGK